MNWRAGVLALLVSMVVTGCGGAGRSSTVSLPGTPPADAVKAREVKLNEELVREDAEGAISFYSDAFRDDKDRTKADKMQELQSLFQTNDLLRIDKLQESFAANPDGSLVTQTTTLRRVLQERATGKQTTNAVAVVNTWANEKGTYRIISSRETAVEDTGTGGATGGETPATPAEKVKLRDRALNEATLRGDVTSIIDFYSAVYRDPEGRGRAERQQQLTTQFQNTEVLRVDVLQESFSTNPDGTLVNHTSTVRVVSRNRQTGEQATTSLNREEVWADEGGAWRLISFSEEPVGSSGGGTGSGIPSEEVKLRDREFDAALTSNNLNALTAIISDAYRDNENLTKAAKIQELQAELLSSRVIRVDVLQETFTATAGGTRVTHTSTIRVTSVNNTTGQQLVEDRTETEEWAKEENGIWRIVSSRQEREGTIDNPNIGVPSQQAIAEARARDLGFNAAVVRGDLEATLAFLSENYFDDRSRTKARQRALLEQLFQKFEITRLDNLDLPDQASANDVLPFRTNPDGTLVLHSYIKRITVRNRATGQLSETLLTGGGHLWANEGGTWRFIDTETIPFFNSPVSGFFQPPLPEFINYLESLANS